MPKLLVSVRDVTEACLAWKIGVGIVDVKEPIRGSLGPADSEVLLQIAASAPPDVHLSAALGELRDGPDSRAVELPERFQFAKIGLAGCGSDKLWRVAWPKALARLPAGIRRVAVGYADWRLAKAPPPTEVTRLGADIGCRAVLVDTYHKQHGNLLNHVSLQELTALRQLAADVQLMFVLAGSLDRKSMRLLDGLNPDYFAVRGAVCRPDRQGSLNAEQLRTLVRECSQANCQ